MSQKQINLIIIVLTAIIIWLLLNKKTSSIKYSIPNEVFDTIKTIIGKNDYGNTIYIAQTKVIEAQAKDLKRMAEVLGKQDSTLRLLAKNITGSTTNATYYNSITNVYGKSDTVKVTDTIDGYPVYESTIADKWYKADMKMWKSGAELNVSFDNPFIVQHKYVKRKLIVEVSPQNPYSKITELKSFTIPKKKHSFDLIITGLVTNRYLATGIEAQYKYKAIGTKAVAGISTLGPYYGVGLNYSIINR
jgi:SOS-response transcriptional repressor LexA